MGRTSKTNIADKVNLLRDNNSIWTYTNWDKKGDNVLTYSEPMSKTLSALTQSCNYDRTRGPNNRLVLAMRSNMRKVYALERGYTAEVST